jgi:hypothetical protein
MLNQLKNLNRFINNIKDELVPQSDNSEIVTESSS